MPSTKISYVDKTWNPVVGCPLPIISKGCENCWARELHNRRNKAKLAGKKLPEMYNFCFEDIQYYPERLDQPMHWKGEKRIFVGSQTDLFHESVDYDFITQMFLVMGSEKTRDHKFFILTKRPKNAVKYFEKTGLNVPANTWFGCTATNCKELQSNTAHMKRIPARCKWVSLEPWLDIRPVTLPMDMYNWAVIGAESGPGKRFCDLMTMRYLVRLCQHYGVPVYVKQVHVYANNPQEFRFSTNPTEWPSYLQFQELP